MLSWLTRENYTYRIKKREVKQNSNNSTFSRDVVFSSSSIRLMGLCFNRVSGQTPKKTPMHFAHFRDCIYSAHCEIVRLRSSSIALLLSAVLIYLHCQQLFFSLILQIFLIHCWMIHHVCVCAGNKIWLSMTERFMFTKPPSTTHFWNCVKVSPPPSAPSTLHGELKFAYDDDNKKVD